MNTLSDSATRPRLPEGRNFIAGEWRDESGAERITVTDPASETVLGDIPCSSAATVDKAVRAARKAFNDPAWSNLAPMEREALLHRLAALVSRCLPTAVEPVKLILSTPG